VVAGLSLFFEQELAIKQAGIAIAKNNFFENIACYFNCFSKALTLE